MGRWWTRHAPRIQRTGIKYQRVSLEQEVREANFSRSRGISMNMYSRNIWDFESPSPQKRYAEQALGRSTEGGCPHMDRVGFDIA